MSDEKRNKKEASTVKTFPVPFSIRESKNNYAIATRIEAKLSKEQILEKAFKFHANGNLLKASKYYKYFIDQGFINPEAFVNYAIILKDLGKSKEAEILTRQAIKIRPDLADAYLNLGNILLSLDKLKEAETSTLKAIKLNPKLAIAHNNLGQICLGLDKLKEAEISTRTAIQLDPNLAIAHNNLGKILIQIENFKEAEISIRRAIELKNDYSDAFSNLGVILNQLNKSKEAEVSLLNAIKLNPKLAIAYDNLGNTLRDLGRLEEAEKSIHKAIQLDPKLASAYNNLGNILRDLGRLKEAEILTRNAIKLNPKSSKLYINLGNILKDIGEFEEAVKFYKKGTQLDKYSSKAKEGLIACKSLICDWSEEETQQDWLKTLGIKGDPVITLGLIYIEDDPLKQLKRSINFSSKRNYQNINLIEKVSKSKIHIGYFSSDFRAHPTMYLISEVLRLHDKSKFEIYLYSFPPQEDKFTRMIKENGCIYRDIKEINDNEAIQIAMDDKLDIAIDLMGYIKYNRMDIFSKRVAPIQINYLGYPGSLGSETIDYIIADNIIIPKEYEQFYSEKVIKMPYCYQCNDNNKEICKEPISRQMFNLPEKGFVFICFNANNKIRKREFDIWMNLLKNVKGSILWLYKSNEWSKSNLFKEAKKRNVDPNRLIFADYLPLKQHLSRYTLGDLGLDTFNFNGHTTTSDALWAGLPVLTKIGESFAARVSSSILSALGVPELITYSDEEYETKALRLANEPDELMRLKIKIENSRHTSPLFDSELFTRDLETKFNQLLK